MCDSPVGTDCGVGPRIPEASSQEAKTQPWLTEWPWVSPLPAPAFKAEVSPFVQRRQWATELQGCCHLPTLSPWPRPAWTPTRSLQIWETLGNRPFILLTCACVLPPTWAGPRTLARRMVEYTHTSVPLPAVSPASLTSDNQDPRRGRRVVALRASGRWAPGRWALGPG